MNGHYDRKITRQIAEDKLKELIFGNKVRIRRMFNHPEYEYLVKGGVEYEVSMNSYYADEAKELLRIFVSVDDGGLFTFFLPVGREAFVIAKDVRNSPAISE